MITYVLSSSPLVRRRVTLDKFPGGEVKVALQSEAAAGRHDKITIQASCRNSDEFMQIIMTLDAVRRKYPKIDIYLELPYLPYARQDRVMVEGESLSVAVVARMLNMFNIAKITLIDVHSPVALSHFNCVENIECADVFDQHFGFAFREYEVVIAPDAGAVKRASLFAKEHNIKTVVVANKVRDPETGVIIDYQFTGDIAGKRCAVVDDICDGGATFIGLAQFLGGVQTVDLIVTHGIFSKGVDHVAKHFNKVYTTNSFNPELKSEGNLIVTNVYR